MNTPIPEPVLAQLDDHRGKILRGETVTQKELADSLAKYRSFREVKAAASQVKREAKAVTDKKKELPPAALELLKSIQI